MRKMSIWVRITWCPIILLWPYPVPLVLPTTIIKSSPGWKSIGQKDQQRCHLCLLPVVKVTHLYSVDEWLGPWAVVIACSCNKLWLKMKLLFAWHVIRTANRSHGLALQVCPIVIRPSILFLPFDYVCLLTESTVPRSPDPVLRCKVLLIARPSTEGHRLHSQPMTTLSHLHVTRAKQQNIRKAPPCLLTQHLLTMGTSLVT